MTSQVNITENSIFWRRINSNPDWIVRDAGGNPVPSSAAFKDYELSTVLEDDRDTQAYIDENYPNCGLSDIVAKNAEALGQEIQFSPVAGEPQHTNNLCCG